MDRILAPGLYVVATPIGNLGDISERAGEVLRAADVVAAEDTRTARIVLRRVGAEVKAVSLTEHNVEQRTGALLAAAREGVVALTSDAGTPVIADPGARLVEAAHGAGVAVWSVPGPSALVAAVAASGFEGSDVHFLGFLPRKRGERRERLATAAAAASVLVFYESPGRLAGSLQDVGVALGDPEVAVCRELTKVHEEVVRGRAVELAARFEEARGECTVVVRVNPEEGTGGDEDRARELMALVQRAGGRRSVAAAEVARATGVARARVYEMWDAGS